MDHRRERRRRGRHDAEKGSATAELVLLTPLLMLVALFAVATGRLVAARLEVNDAAHQAARAASIARTASAADAAARSAVESALGSNRAACASRNVSVGLGSFQPGGNVTVTVTCRARLSDVAMVHIPGSTSLTSTFVVPVDYWRSQ
ncbi:TadE/TadG family type IV pilus assembly protein [Microtetraspora malaysiensis]|uniref:TadE/TadG family type IV pilus assembly protein n=1 Tax=Microtetraspora malaysiensis TaxID=161358 RepID=A0ABW6SXX1_9ACTN